ncbi:hypothetical protein VTJ83DRAFT_4745 [Remersonia thermophila]|uniref:Thioesterase domain-containing protein n=1 Tax=Remersonia thermophila TaxID=72144 RepID=A0ABR4DAV6_9PEZI
MTGSNAPDKTERQARVFLAREGEERIRAVLEDFGKQVADPDEKEWTQLLIPYMKIDSVSSPDAPHPSVTFRFTVQPEHCNRLRNLHGGCTATLFDFCTSVPLALVARPGYWSRLGVSRTLNTTYLRPAPQGTEVIVECDIVQIGRRLCTLRGIMRRASDGTILATCEHGKVNTDLDVGAKA